MRYGIVTLLFIFLVVIGAVAIFGRGNSGPGTSPTSRATKLADYANNSAARVTWTMQGRLIGEDTRKAVRVTVTKNKRTVEILSGYEERVEKSQDFTNNEAAFATFTRALDVLNFGRERTVANADERGVCPQGNRFVYRVTDGTKEVMRTWSSSCSRNDGPFAGTNANVVAQLFRDQITDYNKFIAGIIF